VFTRLLLRNFKGWEDTGPIRLAPITVFFGSNSSGKTSLLCACGSSGGAACGAGGVTAWGRGAGAGARGRGALMLTRRKWHELEYQVR
jgi:predicted ATPase